LADCLIGLNQPKAQPTRAVKVEIFIFCLVPYAENKNTTFTALVALCYNTGKTDKGADPT
jgi:hypothetical protein